MSARASARFRSRPPRPGLFARLLDPIDWLAETIYSVLIVLTFTLVYQAVRFQADTQQLLSRDDMALLLVAAFGCTLAWGLIDGLMHVLLEVFQRGERYRLLHQVQTAASEQAGIAAIAEELDYVLEPITDAEQRDELYRKAYLALREGERRPVGLRREDLAGALGCVLVAVVAVIPPLLPLWILRDHGFLAIRVSNIVSFVVLFFAGYRWGIHTGASPWKTGLLLTAVAALMVAIALPLGG
jgi:VIT1/CCC1 family predicted Fe2+/Mn2+ transporter